MHFYRRFAVLRRWMESHPLFGGAASVLVFLVAFFLRLALNDDLPPGFPYLTFLPAIVIATFLFGTSAGVLCAALSLLSSWYFFLPPFFSFSLSGQTTLALGFFVGIVALHIFLIDRMLVALENLEASRAQAVEFARQRDDLFKELQHRVGNNLNMIAAMLSIQARGLGEENARLALSEASRRIHLVADINRMFHDPAHSDGVLDDAFVRELGTKCLDAAGMRDKVRFTSDIRALAFRQDEFLPISLVLAESINNALEHGIADHSAGHLRVSLTSDDKDAVLSVENDGTPLAPDFNAAQTRSIGLMLVNAFARQLGGSYQVEGGATTRSTLRFPLARSVSPCVASAIPAHPRQAPALA